MIDINQSSLSYGGHFYFHFLDNEEQKLHYINSSYYGKKRILNLGFGYYFHARLFGTIQNGELEDINGLNVIAIDLFYDVPLSTTSALNLNLYVLFQRDFSKVNYYRSFRYLTLNEGGYSGYSGGVSVDGFGNSQPLTGSGDLLLLQAAYYRTLDANKGKGFQLYSIFTSKSLKLTSGAFSNLDFCVSLYFNPNRYKLGTQYSLRPEVFEEVNGLRQHGSRSEAYLNFHISI